MARMFCLTFLQYPSYTTRTAYKPSVHPARSATPNQAPKTPRLPYVLGTPLPRTRSKYPRPYNVSRFSCYPLILPERYRQKNLACGRFGKNELPMITQPYGLPIECEGHRACRTVNILPTGWTPNVPSIQSPINSQCISQIVLHDTLL